MGGRRRIILLVPVAAVALAAALSAGATTVRTERATHPAGATAERPEKQVARLKRQVAALKRDVARLHAANTKLRAALEAASPAGIARQLDAVRQATAPYQSVDNARADGYVAGGPCDSTPQGGMGFHYPRPPLLADPQLDPLKPEILLYAPAAGGGLTLVGVEYWKADADQNLETDDDRPVLFGRAFDGPMRGHIPGMPIHYDLHVWIGKRNPTGMFAQWNPAVTC